jgi:hypothetical protein
MYERIIFEDVTRIFFSRAIFFAFETISNEKRGEEVGG